MSIEVICNALENTLVLQSGNIRMEATVQQGTEEILVSKYDDGVSIETPVGSRTVTLEQVMATLTEWIG